MSGDGNQNKLYVHREEAIQVYQLLVQPGDQPQSENRLISIIGPPGIGKSWFLGYLFGTLPQNNPNILMKIDLSGGDLTAEQDQRQWLQQQIEIINNSYPYDIEFDRSASFELMLRKFVDDLCHCDPKPKPILFVDGFDEIIDSTENKKWQNTLAVFWEGGCTYIIMARRDNQKLTHPMLAFDDTPIQLTPFDEEQQHEQIRKRAGEDADEIIEQIGSFIAGNPFINTELYECIHEKKAFKHSDIQTVIDKFFERANLSQNSQAFDLVKRLAIELPDDWRETDLRLCKPSIRMESMEMEDLFTAGIIQPISGTLRYTIDVGLLVLFKKGVQVEAIENE